MKGSQPISLVSGRALLTFENTRDCCGRTVSGSYDWLPRDSVTIASRSPRWLIAPERTCHTSVRQGSIFASRSWPVWECRNCHTVTAAGDPGRVTAILYSRLATSLRSLAIILPIHLHLLSLASTFATGFLQLPYIYLWGQTQAYMPLHYYCFFSKRIRFAHGITSCLVFTPFSDTRHHGVNNWEYCPPNEI